MKKKWMLTLSYMGILCGALILSGCQSTSADNTTPQAEEVLTEEGADARKAAFADSISYGQNTITVNSSEKVTVIPDIAQVVYSVRSQAKDAAGSQQKNAEAVNQVIGQLTGLNIAETSIQTTDYYINPIYNYSNNTAAITGYEAITTLTVSDLPIEGLSEILTASVASGINTIQSVSYQASKYDESYGEALKIAIASAYEKAAALAEAAGCRLGGVIRIEEISGYTQACYSNTSGMNYSVMKEEAMTDEAARIMPGEIDVEAGIVVEYLLESSAE